MNIDATNFVLSYHITGVAGGNLADGIGFKVTFDDGKTRFFQFGYIDGGFALRIANEWSGAYGISITEEEVTTTGIDVLITRNGNNFSAYYRLNAESGWVKAGNTITGSATEFSIYNWSVDYRLTGISYQEDKTFVAPAAVALLEAPETEGTETEGTETEGTETEGTETEGTETEGTEPEGTETEGTESGKTESDVTNPA